MKLPERLRHRSLAVLNKLPTPLALSVWDWAARGGTDPVATLRTGSLLARYPMFVALAAAAARQPDDSRAAQAQRSAAATTWYAGLRSQIPPWLDAVLTCFRSPHAVYYQSLLDCCRTSTSSAAATIDPDLCARLADRLADVILTLEGLWEQSLVVFLGDGDCLTLRGLSPQRGRCAAPGPGASPTRVGSVHLRGPDGRLLLDLSPFVVTGELTTVAGELTLPALGVARGPDAARDALYDWFCVDGDPVRPGWARLRTVAPEAAPPGTGGSLSEIVDPVLPGLPSRVCAPVRADLAEAIRTAVDAGARFLALDAELEPGAPSPGWRSLTQEFERAGIPILDLGTRGSPLPGADPEIIRALATQLGSLVADAEPAASPGAAAGRPEVATLLVRAGQDAQRRGRPVLVLVDGPVCGDVSGLASPFRQLPLALPAGVAYLIPIELAGQDRFLLGETVHVLSATRVLAPDALVDPDAVVARIRTVPGWTAQALGEALNCSRGHSLELQRVLAVLAVLAEPVSVADVCAVTLLDECAVRGALAWIAPLVDVHSGAVAMDPAARPHVVELVGESACGQAEERLVRWCGERAGIDSGYADRWAAHHALRRAVAGRTVDELSPVTEPGVPAGGGRAAMSHMLAALAAVASDRRDVALGHAGSIRREPGGGGLDGPGRTAAVLSRPGLTVDELLALEAQASAFGSPKFANVYLGIVARAAVDGGRSETAEELAWKRLLPAALNSNPADDMPRLVGLRDTFVQLGAENLSRALAQVQASTEAPARPGQIGVLTQLGLAAQDLGLADLAADVWRNVTPQVEALWKEPGGLADLDALVDVLSPLEASGVDEELKMRLARFLGEPGNDDAQRVAVARSMLDCWVPSLARSPSQKVVKLLARSTDTVSASHHRARLASARAIESIRSGEQAGAAKGLEDAIWELETSMRRSRQQAALLEVASDLVAAGDLGATEALTERLAALVTELAVHAKPSSFARESGIHRALKAGPLASILQNALWDSLYRLVQEISAIDQAVPALGLVASAFGRMNVPPVAEKALDKAFALIQEVDSPELQARLLVELLARALEHQRDGISSSIRWFLAHGQDTKGPYVLYRVFRSLKAVWWRHPDQFAPLAEGVVDVLARMPAGEWRSASALSVLASARGCLRYSAWRELFFRISALLEGKGQAGRAGAEEVDRAEAQARLANLVLRALRLATAEGQRGDLAEPVRLLTAALARLRTGGAGEGAQRAATCLESLAVLIRILLPARPDEAALLIADIPAGVVKEALVHDAALHLRSQGSPVARVRLAAGLLVDGGNVATLLEGSSA